MFVVAFYVLRLSVGIMDSDTSNSLPLLSLWSRDVYSTGHVIFVTT